MTDDEHIILNHIASKLQMYDSEFHKHHCRLMDRIDNAVELEVQKMDDGFLETNDKLTVSEKDCHTTAKTSGGDNLTRCV